MNQSRLPAIHVTLALFSLTLFLSAGLMFSVQPMAGKMLLPLVGGTPAGWIVALAFFQIMLLAGYFLAWLLSRFDVRTHGILYVAALGVGALLLPVALDGSAAAGTAGPFDVFILLTVAVAAPFVALSATASTLQRLFTATGHASAQDPYFLYAASNLGSFAGLFLYPLLVEPFLAIPRQSQYWSAGYALLMGLGLACLLQAKAARENKTAAGKPATWRQRGTWMALAFVPSSLLLGVTTHITTDIFSAPMIWVVPLGIYLLTFVAAFSRRQVLNYDLILKMQPMAVAVATAFMVVVAEGIQVTWQAMLLHVAAFAIVALMCHMRLAAARPLGDDRQLAEFYLMMSIGGALGGVLNAFVAPVVFSQQVEYPLMLIASCLLHPGIRTAFSLRRDGFLLLVGGGLALIYAVAARLHAGSELFRLVLLAYGFSLMALHPRAAAILCAGLFVLNGLGLMQGKPSLVVRNFYGIIKTYDRVEQYDGVPHQLRVMTHGTTVHGTQIRDPGYEREMTSYYTKSSPLANVFAVYNPKNIAVLGLGTGTINCYSTAESAFTFFEIDPAVVAVARERFSYLDKCRGRETPRIVIGDGRLELAKHTGEKFDLIVLDAFSSDMVPTHLLTREAMEVYARRLAPQGIIPFNISNRYFELGRVIAVTADSIGFRNRFMVVAGVKEPYGTSSKWIAVAPDTVSLSPLNDFGWAGLDNPRYLQPWSDDYTNLFDALRF